MNYYKVMLVTFQVMDVTGLWDEGHVMNLDDSRCISGDDFVTYSVRNVVVRGNGINGLFI